MADMVLVELTNRLFVVQALLTETFEQQDPQNVHPHQGLVLAAPFPLRSCIYCSQWIFIYRNIEIICTSGFKVVHPGAVVELEAGIVRINGKEELAENNRYTMCV